MSDDIPDELMPHKGVTFKPFMGAGASGPVLGESVTLPRCLVVDKKRVVRDDFGAEVVSSTTVYLDVVDVQPGSMFTVWPGTPFERESKAIKVGLFDVEDVASFLEVSLE